MLGYALESHAFVRKFWYIVTVDGDPDYSRFMFRRNGSANSLVDFHEHFWSGEYTQRFLDLLQFLFGFPPLALSTERVGREGDLLQNRNHLLVLCNGT